MGILDSIMKPKDLPEMEIPKPQISKEVKPKEKEEQKKEIKKYDERLNTLINNQNVLYNLLIDIKLILEKKQFTEHELKVIPEYLLDKYKELKVENPKEAERMLLAYREGSKK